MSRLTFEAAQAANESRAKRWHPEGLDSWSALEWAGALAGEAGELANVAKKLKRIDDGIVGQLPTEADALRVNLAEELADVVCYALVFASSQGIDLGEAVRRKFNKVSEKHGFPERLEEPAPSEPADYRWLRFFYDRADFGPAHTDVVEIIKSEYRAEVGPLPPGWDHCGYCGEPSEACSCEVAGG